MKTRAEKEKRTQERSRGKDDTGQLNQIQTLKCFHKYYEEFVLDCEGKGEHNRQEPALQGLVGLVLLITLVFIQIA